MGVKNNGAAAASAGKPKTKKHHFPVHIGDGVRPLERKRIPVELIAGTTLAALAIPEVMGYATIAGMPVITGLYTILIPIAIFALFGSSRHLVVGADSASAAIMAAGLTGLAAAGSSEYVALAGAVAILTGAYLLLARILRLGFLADFLSRTVLIGFLTGVGIQVACGQFSGLFGIPKSGSGSIDYVFNTFKDFGQISWATTAVSASVLLVIVLGGKFLPKIPWALIAVIGAILASYAFDFASHGVATIGTVPSGLPSFGFPQISSSDWVALLGLAASIFIIVLAQSAATSRAYAAKFDDDFDENIDLVGLSFASVSAGLSGTFVVNGSPTKTAMVDNAGGKSQLSQLTTALVVLIVLLFLTVPLSYMPSCVLAAVVFLIGVELVDVKGMGTIYHRRRPEFIVALITAVTVIFVGVEQGILLAIVISIVAHLRHSYRPFDRLMTPAEFGDWKNTPLDSGSQAAPGLLVYRFGSSLYYANAGRFAEEVLGLVAKASTPVRWFCFEASNVEDIDFSGSTVLRAVIKKIDERGVTFVMCGVQDPVLAELKVDGLLDVIGEQHVFEGGGDLLKAYRALPAAANVAPLEDSPAKVAHAEDAHATESTEATEEPDA